MQEYERTRDALLDAALPHVPFDGWSPSVFRTAIGEAGLAPAAARAACPRGAVDLAVAFHERGDARTVERLRAEALDEMRVRERVTHAVRVRIEAIEDRDAARRAAALFALPHLSALGARLIWGTADAIWTACGDTSRDANWYSKRATLSGVYGSTVLYWLGDDSSDHAETWAFLDRRIDGIMSFERVKGAVAGNRAFRTVFAGPLWALGQVRAPSRMPQRDMPGVWPDAPSTPPRDGPEPDTDDGDGRSGPGAARVV